jgi:hypothetical protein
MTDLASLITSRRNTISTPEGPTVQQLVFQLMRKTMHEYLHVPFSGVRPRLQGIFVD